MSSCERYLEAMAERLGGELEGAEREQLERHLVVCGDCRSSLEELERVLLSAREVSVPEPPPGYWTSYLPRLRERLEQQPQRVAWLWRSLLVRPAAALAAVSFVLLSLWLWPALPGGGLASRDAGVVAGALELTQSLSVGSSEWVSQVDELAAASIGQQDHPGALLFAPLDDPFAFLDLPGAVDEGERDQLSELLANVIDS